MYVDFNIIEIFNGTSPYPTLLGIGWEMIYLAVINLKKRTMTFENHDTRLITPLDPREGQ